ncbi:hypothetical protein L596_001825 [Steinernema carpocapsae]|uniref:Uncharacterized protein n=1 Tax=Steinernema carpocapsae TaxID=34508 RepID=A0A4U8UMQ2_STECR|nr:hypothetical protein L596_001825 [Steinernema carpocapsae]
MDAGKKKTPKKHDRKRKSDQDAGEEDAKTRTDNRSEDGDEGPANKETSCRHEKKERTKLKPKKKSCGVAKLEYEGDDTYSD